MPIQEEIRIADRLVVVTLRGGVAVADYAAMAEKIIADPRVKSGFSLLVDGRALDPLPGVEELRALVDIARQLRRDGVEPFALVAETDHQFVVGQLFSALAGAMLNLDARVFRSMATALEWLKAVQSSRAHPSS